MVSTEQHSALQICCAVIPNPVVDVVHFAPVGWSVAVAELASTVLGGKRDGVSAGVEALFAAEVECLTVVIEADRHDAGGAGVPFDGCDADPFGLPFDVSDPASSTQVAIGDQKFDRRTLRTEHNCGVGGGADRKIGFSNFFTLQRRQTACSHPKKAWIQDVLKRHLSHQEPYQIRH